MTHGAARPLPTTRAGIALHERGFAVLDERRSDDDVQRLRAGVVAGYEALGSPRTFANPPLEPAPKVEISRVGCVFHQLGAHHPALAAKLLSPELVSVARDVLGDDMHLEYTCAVLCNDERPFWNEQLGEQVALPLDFASTGGRIALDDDGLGDLRAVRAAYRCWKEMRLCTSYLPAVTELLRAVLPPRCSPETATVSKVLSVTFEVLLAARNAFYRFAEGHT